VLLFCLRQLGDVGRRAQLLDLGQALLQAIKLRTNLRNHDVL
jgi:hypothetical protein